MSAAGPSVDYALLARVSEHLVCSRCLRRGRRTPVRQVISKRHRPLSLCPQCRAQHRAAAAPALALLERRVGPRGRPYVVRGRTDQPVVRALLDDVRGPSRDP